MQKYKNMFNKQNFHIINIKDVCTYNGMKRSHVRRCVRMSVFQKPLKLQNTDCIIAYIS